MSALARTTEIDCYTRAANEDCINGGPRTRTKYAYDAANELTGLTYTQANGTPIGNLTYTYDVAGHRSSVGGSLAPSSVPTTASTGTYDANNRVTNCNGSTITYDTDGNALSDGSNTYTWDARNQLTSLTGPINGSFKYDAVGRRVQRILGTATTGFLYDGYSFAQEQSAAGVATATNLTGGIDEIFARMTSTGISVPLTDAIGSVIAETNSAAGVTTTFAYEPFGRTTQTGTSSGNSQQFTGRENDGTGIYYYRARYYSPGRGGFISEDPIGFAGGINAYAYAGGNPISETDPLGLLGMDDIYGFIYDTTGGYTPSQALIDYTAGFGDAASLNITSLIRDMNGTNDLVDKCSTAYRNGGWTTAALGGGRLAYAGLAKALSISAASGAEASAARSALRSYFGGGKSLRPPNLSKYLTDDALRAGAGRTNSLANLYGAAIAALGAAEGAGCGCSN